MDTKNLLLLVATFITGLYAGIGFLGILSFNATLRSMSDLAFADYWQHLDHLMAARMKFFGPLQLLVCIVCFLMLIKQYYNPSFWFITMALVILMVDFIFVIKQNHPLNALIQSWDIHNLPANVNEVKLKVAAAFDIRNWFMVMTFVFTLLSLYFKMIDK